MKTKVLFRMVFLTMLVSCAKAEVESIESAVESSQLVRMTFSADRENCPDTDTKVYPNWTAGRYYWVNGDKMAVFSGGNKYEFTNTAESASSRAVFEGDAVLSGTYYACYPYSEAVSIDGNVITATLPSAQTLDAHGNDPSSYLSVAATTSGSGAGTLFFKNVFSLIKFTLSDDDVTEIVVMGNNGENIAGTVNITVSEEEDPTFEIVSGQTSITLTPSGSCFTSGSSYTVAVLPQAAKMGITLIFKHSGSIKSAARKTSATFDILRNQYLETSSFDFGADDYKYYFIKTKSDLIAWNNDYSNWASGDKVLLQNDIVLDNNVETEPWTAHDFPGTFEGQNHAIKKIHVDVNGNANFFNTVSGTVRNLTFGAATDDDSYFYTTSTGASARYAGPLRNVTGSIANITNYSTVAAKDTAGYYIGGVCCSLSGTATASNCTNYGSVSYDSMSHTHCNVAGVFASVSTTGKVKNCTNYGPVSFKGSKNKGSINMGGILGYCSKATPLDSCTNNGSVTITSATTGGGEAHIGGIIGYNQNTGATLTACCNKGKIENAANTFNAQKSYLGGIIGAVSAANSNIFGCSNEGDITGSTIATYVYNGGIVGYSINSDVTIGSETQPCTNSGDITNSKKSSNASTNAQPNISLGGIVGLSITAPNGGSINYCTNSGKVYNSGALNYNNNLISLGGIIGTLAPTTANPIRHCTNAADVIDEAATTSSKKAKMYLGGIAGYCYTVKAIVEDCVNNGSTVKYNTTYSGISNIGGIVAAVTGEGSEISRCTNNAKLEFYAPGSDIYGGLLGGTSNATFLTDCTNNGDIILNSYASGSIRVGGIVGNLFNGAKAQKAKVTRCTNTGNITGSSTTVKETRIGGIGGSNTNYAVTTTDCCNTGNISYDLKGTTATAALLLGGIFAYSGTSTYTDTNSTSNCTIAHTYETAPTKYQAGLLYGNVPKSVITNCGVAGSLDGVAADAANFETLMIKAKGSGTTTTGCYLITAP